MKKIILILIILASSFGNSQGIIQVGTTVLNKGVKGEKGDAGADGVDGTNGIDGADGAAGIDGAGFGYAVTFMIKKSSGTVPTTPQQYAFYDEIADEVVFDWDGSSLQIKTDNKIHNGTLYLTATNNQVRLAASKYAYVLETDLAETGNFNVPVYYDDVIFSGNLGTTGRILIAIRDATNSAVLTTEQCGGVFADYMNALKNSYLDTDVNDFYELGNTEKDYTPLASKYGLIVWGDSVIDGRVDQADADSWLNQGTPTIPNANIWNYSTNAFTTFELGVNTGSSTKSTTQWGWDMEVYHKLQTYLADDIYIVKQSEGGSDLIRYWDADFNNINTGSGFDILTSELEQRIRAAEKKAVEDGVQLDWRAMIISTGSNDIGSINQATFEMQLTRIVQYVRGVTGNPKLKVVIPSISPSSVRYQTALSGGLKRLHDKDPYTTQTLTPAMTMLADGLTVHPDAAGCIVIGEQVYQEIKDITADVIRTVPNRAETAINTTVINMSNPKGIYYVNSANSPTSYTLSNTHVVGGKSTVWINTASQPTVTGATYRTGYADTFSSSTDMYMKVENIGGVIKYWFETY